MHDNTLVRRAAFLIPAAETTPEREHAADDRSLEMTSKTAVRNAALSCQGVRRHKTKREGRQSVVSCRIQERTQNFEE